MRNVVCLFVLLLPLFAQAAQRSQSLFFWTTPEEQVIRIAHTVPATDAERLARLRQLFIDQQCLGDDLKEKGGNLWCVLPGEDSLTMVVAAHYDRQGKGASAIDDWSGAAMVPLLYKSMTAQPRKHTILFVELAGDKGAGRFLAEFTKAGRKNIAAFVELDALGLGNTAYYIYPDPPGEQIDLAEDHLAMLMYASARMMGTAEQPVYFDSRPGLKHDQTQRFRWSEIPSITVHSISRQTTKIPGSELDTPLRLQDENYYKSYRLLCAYIAYTDTLLDKLSTDDDVWHGRGSHEDQKAR